MAETSRRQDQRAPTSASSGSEQIARPTMAPHTRVEPLRPEQREFLRRRADAVPLWLLASAAELALFVWAILTPHTPTWLALPSALLFWIFLAAAIGVPLGLRARKDLKAGTASYYTGPIELRWSSTENGTSLALRPVGGPKINAGPRLRKAVGGRRSSMNGTLVFSARSKRTLFLQDASGVPLYDATLTRRERRRGRELSPLSLQS